MRWVVALAAVLVVSIAGTAWASSAAASVRAGLTIHYGSPGCAQLAVRGWNLSPDRIGGERRPYGGRVVVVIRHGSRWDRKSFAGHARGFYGVKWTELRARTYRVTAWYTGDSYRRRSRLVVHRAGNRACPPPQTTITCATRSWAWMNPQIRPDRCVIFRGNVPAHAYELDLRSIHWRGWGAGVAQASADSVYIGMGYFLHSPVSLVAYGRRRGCRPRVWAYTRLRIRFISDGRTSTLAPPRCTTSIG
jgi:hypothetical protein